jgi:hypothetical protein
LNARSLAVGTSGGQLLEPGMEARPAKQPPSPAYTCRGHLWMREVLPEGFRHPQTRTKCGIPLASTPEVGSRPQGGPIPQIGPKCERPPTGRLQKWKGADLRKPPVLARFICGLCSS